jgi:hypothetical protein
MALPEFRVDKHGQLHIIVPEFDNPQGDMLIFSLEKTQELAKLLFRTACEYYAYEVKIMRAQNIREEAIRDFVTSLVKDLLKPEKKKHERRTRRSTANQTRQDESSQSSFWES